MWGPVNVKGLIRSLLLMVGLTCLPACAASQGSAVAQPSAQTLSAPSVPQQNPPVAVTSRHSVEVRFDKDSAAIRAAAMQILYGAAQELRGQRITSIQVIGYTDASGRRSYNQRLSQRRADAVADQLSKLGLFAERIEVLGGGEITPRGKGAKRAADDDRRVEIVIETVSDHIASIAPMVETAQAPSPGTPDIAASLPSDQVALHMPVWLQPVHKPAIKPDLSAIWPSPHGADRKGAEQVNRPDGRKV